MFCSNCGKTIRPEDDACQHCGAQLGEGRFYGNTYTSSQVRLPAEAVHEAPAGGMIAYTRTSYMSYDNQPQDNVYSNTTYRPLLSDEEDLTRIEAEEAARRAAEEAEAQAAQEAAEAEANAAEPADSDSEAEVKVESDAESQAAPAGEAGQDGETGEASDEIEGAEEINDAEENEAYEDEVEDIPEVSTSPLPALKKAAISPRVLSYMQEMEEREQRRSGGGGLKLPAFLKRKKNQPIEEPSEYASEETSDEAFDETFEEASEYAFDEASDESSDAAFDEALKDAVLHPIEEEPPVETTYADGDEGEFADEAADPSEEDEYEITEDDSAGEYLYDGDDASDEYVAQQQYDDFEYYEDTDGDIESEAEADGESARARFSLNIDWRALLQNRLLKIIAASVLVIAVVIAGIVWLSFVTTKRAKIIDVTYSTYSQGIELLKSSLTEEYRSEMKDTYLVNTSAANSSFSADIQALNALLPAEPQANDPLFVNALTIIQDSIADAIKADADAELKSEDRSEASARDWQAIENAVAQLEQATNVGQLSAIVGDLESVVAPTPTPTPQPSQTVYPTLQNGMMDSVQVQIMQNRLINLGFLSGEPDGDFGNGTESAVKAFQRAAGLTASGVADHETQAAMFAEDAPHVSPEATETVAPASPDATAAG